MIGTPGVSKPAGGSVTKPGITVTDTSGGKGDAAMGTGLLGPGLLPLTNVPTKMSSSEAAANWLKSAQEESTGGAPSDAVQKAAVSWLTDLVWRHS